MSGARLPSLFDSLSGFFEVSAKQGWRETKRLITVSRLFFLYVAQPAGPEGMDAATLGVYASREPGDIASCLSGILDHSLYIEPAVLLDKIF